MYRCIGVVRQRNGFLSTTCTHTAVERVEKSPEIIGGKSVCSEVDFCALLVERWWGRGEGRIAHEGNERIEPVSYSGVVVWELGVPLMEEWSWTGGELVVGARGFGGWIKK